MSSLNFKHLRYFWAVAANGTIARASEILHVTPQTISGQLRELEEQIDAKLFQKSGRNLVLTDTGRLVFSYADEMFRLGDELQDVIEGRTPGAALTLTVGVAMVVPKLLAYRVLEPVLNMPESSLGWVRQVQLLCDGKPWVYARTIIPLTSLRGRLRRLAHLGTRPLGGMLFADPGMRREIVELACIRKGQDMYAAATRGLTGKPDCVWGRRAVFRIARKPLLVSEVFLPAFPACTATAPLWKSR